MFRRSNSGELVFMQRETYSKENVFFFSHVWKLLQILKRQSTLEQAVNL